MKFINNSFAQMLKGGVIMDVSSVEEAIIAENSGACAVMALDMIPSKIRKEGGIARMANINLVESIRNTVSIPVMAKCRIGHIIEARILENSGIDFIDESEVLTYADKKHINKNDFKIPFVCGAKNLGEALRRIYEGATMIRTKGEAGTGDISQAVIHMKSIKNHINVLSKSGIEERLNFCYKEKVDFELLKETLKRGRLPVVTFAAGGIATPADAALMMSLGADGIFVGSGIFESSNSKLMAENMVKATIYYNDYKQLLEICKNNISPMKGTNLE